MLHALAALAWVAGALFAPPSVRAATPAPAPSCSWDRPGHDSFTGDVPAAVDRYVDLAPDVRERLKARMRRHDYDDVVEISRDRIAGRAGYGSSIRGMHFGEGRVCASVSRERWSEDHVERALVYCEGNDCVMVPTVCRNVSRIQRVPGGGAPPGEGELPFDPPGAGAPTPVPMGDVPPEMPVMPEPVPLTGVPVTPPGALLTPPRAVIGPPSAGPPTSIPTPPVFVLPPKLEEPPVPAVPEPSTLWTSAAGVLLLASLVLRTRSLTGSFVLSSPCPSPSRHPRRRRHGA
ncbi:MHFG family PEP-CTERM protein [Mitsuaria sp. GD03876]|uniref:MHFG family PEP-CTERM protein n=1 Tax=Mitsuaria sp. GD03876 TaxID=2975399 RepID=UPI0024497214|nr:MHFG family PEP-CTERM protein [Mitsuaria sp. GD03876]MDH0867492.1 MHFG family PEP-CTERM protein [Mitsuaria sp. GD03876]